MKARLGAPKAISATAHKLARMVYFTLKYGWAYVDKGAQWYEQQFRQRLLKSLQSRALQLGYTLTPIANAEYAATQCNAGRENWPASRHST